MNPIREGSYPLQLPGGMAVGLIGLTAGLEGCLF